MKTTLIYVHDPMCSWCWGFADVYEELLEQLPPEVEIRRLLGGLAPDSDAPMPESYSSHGWNHCYVVMPWPPRTSPRYGERVRTHTALSPPSRGSIVVCQSSSWICS
jgi:protein-disulfide isomerase-like protein with CxxC motif